jgi:hypothetical protein
MIHACLWNRWYVCLVGGVFALLGFLWHSSTSWVTIGGTGYTWAGHAVVSDVDHVGFWCCAVINILLHLMGCS